MNEIMVQVKIVISHTFHQTFYMHPTQAKVEVDIFKWLTYAFRETFFFNSIKLRLKYLLKLLTGLTFRKTYL